MNYDYFHGAKCRYVYGRDEETLKQSRLMRLKWAPGERSNDVSRGWSMMQNLHQIAKIQLEYHDVEHAWIRDKVARELVEKATSQSERATNPPEQHQ